MIVFAARRIYSLAEPTEAFAVDGERIVASGSRADLRSRFREADWIDLDGVVVPGFNDAHMHPSQAAEDLLHVDVSSNVVHSNADLLAALRSAADTSAAGEWIRASRYDDGKMAEGRLLTRWDLDSASPEHPALVVHVAGHWAVANSRALELAGLDDRSVAPDGGAYGRDASGHLNGVLYERALFGFDAIPETGLEDRLSGLRRALDMFHAAGLTSLGDAHVSPADVALYDAALARGELSARINVLVGYPHFARLRERVLSVGEPAARLRFNGIKAFVDGAIGGRTCLLEEPFEGTADHGMQTTSTADLFDLVRDVHGRGVRLGVHANGDRAIRLLLDAFEAAHVADPRPALHHRIEHCTVIADDIVQRMRRLGAIAVPFGSYVHYHAGNLLAWYGAERVERMFAHRTLLDSGVAVAGASDYPCGPFEPLLAMQSCVTRTGWDGAPIGVSQRISARQALELYTTGAAYASDEHGVKGRLAPGYVADFVVLDADPLDVEPSSLGSVGVRATYVGGAQVWPRRSAA